MTAKLISESKTDYTDILMRTKNIRIILLILFGLLFTYKLRKTLWEYFIFDGFILLFIGIGGFVLFIWTLNKDSDQFISSRKWISYFPTSIGLLFILINAALIYYQDHKKNSATLISGFYDGGYNGFSVDFKVNGSYVMANGSGLGQSYFYGRYTIQDSIITIDRTEIDNCIKTNKFVIRTEDYFLIDSIEMLKSEANYITQIDKTGREIHKEFRFKVLEDNRKALEK